MCKIIRYLQVYTNTLYFIITVYIRNTGIFIIAACFVVSIESVALLVARRTNNRKVVGSRPAKVVCITVLTGDRLG